MAVVYEVNIDVHPALFPRYLAWLRPHAAAMHGQIHGLLDARIAQRGDVPAPADYRPAAGEAAAPATWKGLTAAYLCPSQAALDDYLTHRAAANRGDALKVFGSFDQLRFQRRVLTHVEVLPKPE